MSVGLMNYCNWDAVCFCLDDNRYNMNHVAIVTDFYNYNYNCNYSKNDSYLNFLAVWLTFQSSLQVIIKQPVPGWIEYVKELGFGSHLTVVNAPEFSPIITKSFNWNILNGKKSITNYPQSWYKNSLVKSSIQKSVDSKDTLKEKPFSVNIPNINGCLALNVLQIKNAGEEYGYPLYLKRKLGSGGDFVRFISSEGEILEGLAGLFGKHISNRLPEPIIVERDITSPNSHEKVIGNYCISSVIGTSDYRIVGITKQIVERKGQCVEWVGSQKADLPSLQNKILISHFEKLVVLLRKYGYVGALGADVFLLRSGGKLHCAFFDINARFPVSFFGCLVGNALNFNHWIIINAKFPFLIRDFKEIRNAGLLWPNIVYLALHSSKKNHSSNLKLFIGGNSKKEIQVTMSKLERNNVIISGKKEIDLFN